MKTMTLTVPALGECYYACRTAATGYSGDQWLHDYSIYIREYITKAISYRDLTDPIFQSEKKRDIDSVPEFGPGNYTVKLANKRGALATASPLVEGDWTQLVSSQKIAELPVIFFSDRERAREYAAKVQEAIRKNYKAVGTVIIR